GGDLGGELLVVAVPVGEVALDVDRGVLLLELLDGLLGQLLPGVAAPVGEGDRHLAVVSATGAGVSAAAAAAAGRGGQHGRRQRGDPHRLTRADIHSSTSSWGFTGGEEELLQASGRHAADQVLLPRQEEPEDR